MSTSLEYKEYILELLGDFNIETRRMFSGVLLKVDGEQLGIIISNILYFKVTNKKLQEKFLAEGSVQFSYVRKDKSDPIIIKNWWSVPDRYMDNKEKITDLASKILEQE